MNVRQNNRQDLIDAGMAFSRWMRTHETIQIQYRDFYFGGRWNDLMQLTGLPGRPILEFINSADLSHIQASSKDQANWTAERWAQEIDGRLEIAENMQAR